MQKYEQFKMVEDVEQELIYQSLVNIDDKITKENFYSLTNQEFLNQLEKQVEINPEQYNRYSNEHYNVDYFNTENYESKDNKEKKHKDH